MQGYVIASICSFLFQNAVSAVGNYQTRTEYLRVEKNKKIKSVNLTAIGRMSQSQCAIEAPNADRTELNAIEIICGSRSVERCGDTVSSGQQQWGKWTVEALCPAKTFLTAFSLQVHQLDVNTDNTGANYVRFKCRHFKDEYSGFDLSVSWVWLIWLLR
ncbi:unnamed protein product [Mytilus edulis]|uniref:Uncharacterized protein n=1 Tax=Mytilus edulis TaxID=6550 RepID=A0A8S3UY11_MYTED|nr:unnamed protein product [Mytilus edulis]